MFETARQAFETLVEGGDTYLFLLPIYGLLISGEWVAHGLLHRAWNDRDAVANVAITIVQLGLNIITGHLLPLAAMIWLFDHANLFQLGDGIGSWITAFVLYDLAWYIDHRLGHRIGLLWAMHHVHHSSTEYNMTVASRGFVFDITLLPRPTFYLLPIVGVAPYQFVAIVIFSNIWGIAQHTRLVPKSPWLDWLVATPSNHRVHHGRNPKYIDRNYGEVFMIWDHLFRTYQAEEEEPDYGVVQPIDTYNPLWIEVAGLRWLAKKMRSARNWRDRIRCLHMPPEWVPAGAPTVSDDLGGGG